MTTNIRPFYALIAEYVADPETEPIYLRWSSKSASVLFFGSSHSFDPADPQYPLIVEQFKAFAPGVVIVEGAAPFSKTLEPAEFATERNSITELSNEDRIRRAAEVLFVANLAIESRSFLYSPGFNLADSINFIVEVTGEEISKIVLYFACLEIGVFNSRKSPKPRLDIYLLEVMEYIQNQLRMSLQQMQVLKVQLNLAVERFFSVHDLGEIPPSEITRVLDRVEGHAFTDISRKLALWRDISLFQDIHRFCSGGERIFVCYGRTHLLRLKPALDAYFKELATRSSL